MGYITPSYSEYTTILSPIVFLEYAKHSRTDALVKQFSEKLTLFPPSVNDIAHPAQDPLPP